MVEYTRPYLYPKQRDAIFTNKRWALCEASTKSGKTVASIVRIIEWGLLGNGKALPAPGQNYWWVAPVSSQAAIAFNRVKQNLTTGSFTSRESPTPSINLITGPTLSFKSADNPDSLYGEDVFGVIMDEASRAAAAAWHAVRSTLTATGGPGVLIGNVKGRKNWFYDFCRRVEANEEPNGHFARITWRDAVEAKVLDLEEIEDAKRNLPEQVFQELYEALASDDSANPFGLAHIKKCIGPLSTRKPVAFGVDLAKKQDYLVVIGLDELGEVCVFERWNGVPWPESIRDIHKIIGEDTPALIDSTGLGDPVLDALRVDHGNFRGFTFSAPSKQRLMEGLTVAIQSGEVTFPDGPIRRELESFEYVYTRTGVAYAAPQGFHDDCVMALALARQMWTETAPSAAIMEFYASQARKQRFEAEAEQIPDSIGTEFIRELQRPRAEVVNDELSELYEAALRENSTVADRMCAFCHRPIHESERISDGMFSWHPNCYGITSTLPRLAA